MKKHTILMVALILLSAGFQTKAQSVDKIIDTYFENVGGKDKWSKVTSMVMEGEAQVQGRQIPMKIYRQQPNSLRMEFSLQGKTVVQQAFDGKDAWGMNFMTGKMEKKPEEVTKELAKEKFEPFYLNYKKKGHKIVLEGKEEIEGSECYKLKATKKDGEVIYLFFDTENSVLIMSRNTIKSGPAKGQQTESYVSDYKEVNGLMIPHALIEKVGGQKINISIKKITINSKLDAKLFAFPKE